MARLRPIRAFALSTVLTATTLTLAPLMANAAVIPPASAATMVRGALAAARVHPASIWVGPTSTATTDAFGNMAVRNTNGNSQLEVRYIDGDLYVKAPADMLRLWISTPVTSTDLEPYANRWIEAGHPTTAVATPSTPAAAYRALVAKHVTFSGGTTTVFRGQSVVPLTLTKNATTSCQWLVPVAKTRPPIGFVVSGTRFAIGYGNVPRITAPPGALSLVAPWRIVARYSGSKNPSTMAQLLVALLAPR